MAFIGRTVEGANYLAQKLPSMVKAGESAYTTPDGEFYMYLMYRHTGLTPEMLGPILDQLRGSWAYQLPQPVGFHTHQISEGAHGVYISMPIEIKGTLRNESYRIEGGVKALGIETRQIGISGARIFETPSAERAEEIAEYARRVVLAKLRLRPPEIIELAA